jgi:hypothetical protein
VAMAKTVKVLRDAFLKNLIFMVVARFLIEMV